MIEKDVAPMLIFISPVAQNSLLVKIKVVFLLSFSMIFKARLSNKTLCDGGNNLYLHHPTQEPPAICSYGELKCY